MSSATRGKKTRTTVVNLTPQEASDMMVSALGGPESGARVTFVYGRHGDVTEIRISWEEALE